MKKNYRPLMLVGCFSILCLSVAPAISQEIAADISYVGESLQDVVEQKNEAAQEANTLMIDDSALPSDEQSFDGLVNVQEQEKVMFASINPNRMRSLVYSEWEHAAVIDALAARDYIDVEAYKNRDLGGPDVSGEDPFDTEEPVNAVNTIRELRLGGILYIDRKDWTIWLNGQRVTPSSKPEEVVDLKVYKDYIELKWLDQKTLKVYPIRLRAHQRFNLDNHLFLPG